VKLYLQEPGLLLHSSMYKYFQLNLFLVLIKKFDKRQTFSLDLPELDLIRAE